MANKDIFLLLAKEPPVNLKEKILIAIKEKEIEERARKNLRLIFGSVFISLVSFPYSWPNFLYDFKTSGFYYFFKTLIELVFLKKISLIFQKEFLYAFLDFFPVGSFLFSLVNLFFVSAIFYYLFTYLSFKKIIKILKTAN